MQTLDAAQLVKALPYKDLVEGLRKAFADGCSVPGRSVHDIQVPGSDDASLLLMPAWREGEHIGVKLVTVFPGNSDASVNATYMLFDGTNGKLVAQLDGDELTLRRTAAASALASSYLSRKDSRHLLMVGTGKLSKRLVEAHASVRPIDTVTVWGRSAENAASVVNDLVSFNFDARVETDLQLATTRADIISTATLASNPLVMGEWLQDGQHLDLVGAFKPSMAEADGEALRRASVFVDTREGALAEAGEIIQAINRGFMEATDIMAELSQLCTGETPGRVSDEEITLFKSCGTALEDLAAARLAMENAE